MFYLMTYVAMMLIFLTIDAVWIKWVMKPLFDRHVGELLAERMRLGVAAGFYLFYVAGIVYFAVAPADYAGDWTDALLKGLLFGAIAYGTYEFTNIATLKGWHWSMVATDVAWGAALTGLTAVVGYVLLSAIKPV